MGLYQSEEIRDQNGNLIPGETTEIPLVVIWLVLGAIFFTVRMGFINFWGFKHALDLVRGKFDDPNHKKGEVSHFQALATALSATVGLGNIAGVAIAISIGGPGATFWMIVSGLLGMSSKFVECTLAVKYRQINSEGTVFGGPFYYLSKGLDLRGMGGFGRALAAIFAVLCIGGSIAGGCMFQVNQSKELFGTFVFEQDLTGYGALVYGIVFSLLIGIVIIGGIKSIAKVTDKIVPFMAGLYVMMALIIIGVNASAIPTVISLIIQGAFSPEGAFGGFIGVLIMGFRRAAFSNEAGVGSASIAHAAAKTDEPVSEGTVALLEPFIDTVVVCTLTAFVIIITGAYQETSLGGAELTARAFAEEFTFFKYILSISVLLFAFSTAISWSYYGENAWAYLFGRTKRIILTYKLLFLLFPIIGATIKLQSVMDFSDAMILGMAFPNIIGLVIMSSEVKKDVNDYFARIKSGAIKRYDKVA